MPFDAYDVALTLLRQLRQPLEVLARKDAHLADQLRRAAQSVPLNVAEGRRRAGRDRLHLWRIAAGSADEARACLQVAEALGYFDQAAIAGPLGLCDRVLAMLFRLTR